MKLKILLTTIGLLLGKSYKHPNQPYTIKYVSGAFRTETGTIVGELSKLIPIKDTI